MSSSFSLPILSSIVSIGIFIISGNSNTGLFVLLGILIICMCSSCFSSIPSFNNSFNQKGGRKKNNINIYDNKLDINKKNA